MWKAGIGDDQCLAFGVEFPFWAQTRDEVQKETGLLRDPWSGMINSHSQGIFTRLLRYALTFEAEEGLGFGRIYEPVLHKWSQ